MRPGGQMKQSGMTYIGESKDQIPEMSVISRLKEEKEYWVTKTTVKA